MRSSESNPNSTVPRADVDSSSAHIISASAPEWDAARRCFNLLIDQRPEAIALPEDARGISATVRFARERGWRIAAQATGHNAGPLGPLDGTLVLNTSRLGGVWIDAEARTVRVEAGVRWEQVLGQLSGLGLAALHGSSPDVGVVGYSLGGGLGWLARRHGLQCNSVRAIELVSAEGDLLRADAAHEPELFWALRGGGGSFGVVSAIEFEAYPVQQLHAGAMFFSFERAAEVIGTWSALLEQLPDEITTWVNLMHFPELPFVPEPFRGRSFAVVLGACLTPEPDARSALAPIRELGPSIDTFATVAPDALGTLAMDPPDPMPYLTAHRILRGMPEGVTEDLVAAAGPASGVVIVQLRHLCGALARIAPAAGARATVPGEVAMLAVGAPGLDGSIDALSDSLHAVAAACEPCEMGQYASFVETPTEASTLYDPQTWSRLQAVKALYDPDEVFRGNHHVPPPAAAGLATTSAGTAAMRGRVGAGGRSPLAQDPAQIHTASATTEHDWRHNAA